MYDSSHTYRVQSRSLDTVEIKEVSKNPQVDDKTEKTANYIIIDAKSRTLRKVESRYDNAVNKNAITRITFSEYKMLGNVNFPANITVEKLTGSRGLVNEKPWMTTQYKLEKSAFGVNADVSRLDFPLPVGSIIRDYRFGSSLGVRYKIRKGGIPSDDWVNSLLKKGQIQEESGKRQQTLSTARNYVLPAGALLLVGGLFWFRRPRQAKT